MATSGQNIYMVKNDVDQTVVFVDAEEINDRHLLHAFEGGAEAGGAQRLLEQRKYKYVFRKMGAEEFNAVRRQGGLKVVEGATNETWFTEEIGHSRKYNNRGIPAEVKREVAEFKVHRQHYKETVRNNTIPQRGSRQTNRARIDEGKSPHNVWNRERLGKYPKEKLNIGLKGPENHNAFNETVIAIKKADPHAFKNKNALTRWVSRNKLGIGLAAVGLALDAYSITMAVLDDKGTWGKHTTMALSSISGSYAGGAIGAEIGAALGSVFPLVGTVIGGFIGALLGGVLGSLGAEAFAGIWVSLRRVAPGPGPPPLMFDLGTHNPPPLDIECEAQGPPECDVDLTEATGAPELDFDLADISGAPALGF